MREASLSICRQSARIREYNEISISTYKGFDNITRNIARLNDPTSSSLDIKVVIADDHAIVLEGIALLLRAYFQVVGLATNGVEAISMTEKLCPTVLVLDLMIPNLNGLEVIHQLQQRDSKTKVIILSMNDDEAQIARAIKAGSYGYVLKQAGGDGLIQAIQDVAHSKRYFTPTINIERVEQYLNNSNSIALDPYDMLTVREREIVSLVVEGSTSQEIATQLFLSVRTVEVHRANIMRKLNVNSTAALIRAIIKRNNL